MDEHDRSLIQAYAEALAEGVPARATLEDVDGKCRAQENACGASAKDGGQQGSAC
jgi:hypothetical protein